MTHRHGPDDKSRGALEPSRRDATILSASDVDLLADLAITSEHFGAIGDQFGKAAQALGRLDTPQSALGAISNPLRGQLDRLRLSFDELAGEVMRLSLMCENHMTGLGPHGITKG